jgi:uncharacterized protein (TIRG00374 family)
LPLRSIESLTPRRTILIMIIGLLVFALYFYFSVDTEELLIFLVGVNSLQFLALFSAALGLVILSVFFWSLAWQNILQQLSIKVTTRKMFNIYWAGYFLDLFVPFERIAGDIVRIYLLKKQTKAYYATLVSSTVIDRLIAYFPIVAGLIFAAIILVIYSAPLFVLTFFAFTSSASFIYFFALLYLAFNRRASQNIARIYIRVRRLIRRGEKDSNIKETKILNSLKTFYDEFAPFRKNIKGFKKAIIFHVVAFILRIIVYFFVFYSLGLVFLPIAFFITVYFLGGAVQDAFGSFSVGSLDILLVTLFGIFGIDTGASGIAALLVRSADFWFPLLIALVFIQLMGVRNLIFRIPQKRKAAIQANA